MTLLMTASYSNAGLLTIEINDNGGLSESQYSLFNEASTLWSTFLTGVQSAADHLLTINASGLDIDGQGGVLGRAGPSRARVDSELGYAYATQGVMEFDRADLDKLESDGKLFDVILHEISHAMGYGSLWNTDSFGGVFAGTQSVYADGTGRYTGRYALDVYKKEFDPDATYIPVELDGGEGTADSHWDEAWAGGSNEVLTGYLGSNTYLSDTSIASFADIGYTTIVTHPQDSSAVSVSAPATLGLFSLSLLVAFRRRK